MSNFVNVINGLVEPAGLPTAIVAGWAAFTSVRTYPVKIIAHVLGLSYTDVAAAIDYLVANGYIDEGRNPLSPIKPMVGGRYGGWTPIPCKVIKDAGPEVAYVVGYLASADIDMRDAEIVAWRCHMTIEEARDCIATAADLGYLEWIAPYWLVTAPGIRDRHADELIRLRHSSAYI